MKTPALLAAILLCFTAHTARAQVAEVATLLRLANEHASNEKCIAAFRQLGYAHNDSLSKEETAATLMSSTVFSKPIASPLGSPLRDKLLVRRNADGSFGSVAYSPGCATEYISLMHNTLQLDSTYVLDVVRQEEMPPRTGNLQQGDLAIHSEQDWYTDLNLVHCSYFFYLDAPGDHWIAFTPAQDPMAHSNYRKQLRNRRVAVEPIPLPKSTRRKIVVDPRFLYYCNIDYGTDPAHMPTPPPPPRKRGR